MLEYLKRLISNIVSFACQSEARFFALFFFIFIIILLNVKLLFNALEIALKKGETKDNANSKKSTEAEIENSINKGNENYITEAYREPEVQRIELEKEDNDRSKTDMGEDVGNNTISKESETRNNTESFNSIPEEPKKDGYNNKKQSVSNKCLNNSSTANVKRYRIADENLKYLIEREVKWLYHFTYVDNIVSILKYGILSRNNQERKGVESKYNDPNETGSNYISVSIEWPNYKMFYKKRIDNPHERFAVVCISIYALTECQYRMYSTNSSKGYGSSLVKNANDLYYDSPSRKSLLSKKFPTDPQAELRISDMIPKEYIRAVYFETQKDLKDYSNVNGMNTLFRVASDLFASRKDYEYWR